MSITCVKSKLPGPKGKELLEKWHKYEADVVGFQAPVVWQQAKGCIVTDVDGNNFIDWTSGVLVTNVGHCHPQLVKAVQESSQKLMNNYECANEYRIEAAKRLVQALPNHLDQCFFLSTGSEATENCIKLAKTYALEKHGPERRVIVSFQNAFHGRTLGAQLAGGMPELKTWVGCKCPDFVQVPFPDGYKNEDTSFDLFLSTLQEKGVEPNRIAGVISETYQGVGPDFMPVEYARKLEAFCRKHDIVLIMDEVQAGFGRTGRMFGFQHYGIRPDLIACGKGITSSLPLSAVIGRKDIMGLYAPGLMTLSHSASPLPVVSALANLKIIIDEQLSKRAERLGEILLPELERIRAKYPDVLGCMRGKGLVAGIQVVKPGTKVPNPELALAINVACFRKGLLMFAPVGIGGECLKISPPLTIDQEALKESIAVFEEAVDQVLGDA